MRLVAEKKEVPIGRPRGLWHIRNVRRDALGTNFHGLLTGAYYGETCCKYNLALLLILACNSSCLVT